MDAEGREDQRFLLIDDLGEIREAATIEGSGIDVNVDAATLIHAGACSEDDSNHLLQPRDVFVGEYWTDDLGSQRWPHTRQ